MRIREYNNVKSTCEIISIDNVAFEASYLCFAEVEIEYYQNQKKTNIQFKIWTGQNMACSQFC
jgi:uncharacterized membrane protein